MAGGARGAPVQVCDPVALARLHECGVPGDGDALATLLAAAGFDADRAVNMFLDSGASDASGAVHQLWGVTFAAPPPRRGPSAPQAGAAEMTARAAEAAMEEVSHRRGQGRSSRVGKATVRVDALPAARSTSAAAVSSRSGVDASGRTVSAASNLANGEGPISGVGGTPGLKGAKRETGDANSYHERSARRGQRLGANLTLLRSEGQDVPYGVRYEASPGEDYEIDVAKMEQTHLESGSVRRIRREKPNVWRFFKKGSSWGIYPEEVSRELERIFLARGRQGQYWIRTKKAREDARAIRAVAEASAAEHANSRLIPGVPPTAEDLHGADIVSVCEVERTLPTRSLSLEALSAMRELALAVASARRSPEDEANAIDLMSSLVTRHELCCSVDDVRRAGLVVGSMRLLHAMLAQRPGNDLVGQDIFDKKYTRLRLDDIGRKDCLRCLLARGMRLGSRVNTPQSKLLHKVEKDAEPLWEARFLDSMMVAHPSLPDLIRTTIQLFLRAP